MRAPTFRTLSTTFAAVAVALLASGCGASPGGAGAGGPASLVPASAPFYIEVVVRPEGAQRAGAEGALRKLLRTDDPAGRIRRLVDSLTTGASFKYDRDIKPWLGRRVGIFATAFTGADGTGALIASTTDPEKARAALHRVAKSDSVGKVVKRQYKGVDYELDTGDNTATGVVGGFAVIGTESGLKETVDTRGGRSLAESPDYRAERSPGPPDAAGHLVTAYINPNALIDAFAPVSGLDPRELAPVREALATAGTRAIGLGLLADAGKLALDAETLSSKPVPLDRVASPGVQSLPGDAWLAFSTHDLGSSLTKSLDQLGNIAAFGGVDLEQALRDVERMLGLDLRRDLLSWMGDAGLFVRGTSVGTLGGALVISSKNPGRSRAAVGKLGRVLRSEKSLSITGLARPGVDAGITVRVRSFPIPIEIASAGDQFVIAVTDAALRDAVRPPTRLEDVPQFAAAKRALVDLGSAPQFFLDTPALVTLAGGLGLGTDADFRAAKPYLDALGPIAATFGAVRSSGGRGVGSAGRIALVLR